jgi:flagellar biosynthesis protein FlhF
MQIKKFEAPTIQEALDAIKRELGPEAIILQTKRNRKGFGLLNGSSVEITAAISERSIHKKNFLEKRIPAEKRELMQKMPASRQADLLDQTMEKALSRTPYGASKATTNQTSRGSAGKQPDRRQPDVQVAKITSTRYIDIDPDNNPSTPEVPITPRPKANPIGGLSMEEELREMKRVLSDLQISQNQIEEPKVVRENDYTEAMQDAFDHLQLSGVDRKIARSLLKKVTFELNPETAHDPDAILDQLTLEVMNSVKTCSLFEEINASTESKIIALVGPTGVGKTTTLAKIASIFLLRGKKRVGLMNLDTFKVGASEQLQTYARILNVPFRSVANEEEFKTALEDFKALDLVLIDTTGRSQRDLQALKELQALLIGSGKKIESVLCMSSSIRDTEANEVIQRFDLFKPKSIVVTKLDEAMIHGCLLNISLKSGLPLSFFTTGQRVPDDIEEASSERVAALVMDL